MNHHIELFSPIFKGNNESWAWLCARSAGVKMDAPALNDAQIKSVLICGLITNSEVKFLRDLI